MRIVGYTRRSRERENGYSLEDQESKVRAWAEYRGAEVVEVVSDDDVSGRSKPEDRPGLSRALDLVESGGADAIAFAKLDRLARSVPVFSTLMQRSRDGDWGVVCLDPEFDTTSAAGRLVAHVFSSVAQWELENTVERLQGGRRAKARQGGYVGGDRRHRRYGHRLVEGANGKRRYEPVPEEQAVIRRMRELRAGQRTLQEVCTALDDQGVPPPSGARWYPATVSRILARVTP